MLIEKKRKEYILFILLLVVIPFLPGVRGGYCATLADKGSCESAGCTWVPGVCSDYSRCSDLGQAACIACPSCTWGGYGWYVSCTGSISCASLGEGSCQSCGCTWAPGYCKGEDGSFTWYSSGGSICKTKLVGVSLVGIQTYYDNIILGPSCCDKKGDWITVKFCGAGSCSSTINTEYVDCIPGSTQCIGNWVQTCPSCKWQNYRNCDLSDGCSGTEWRDYYCSGGSCVYTTPNQDDSQTYCDCLGTGLWNIGGEVAQTTCCGDDSGEYKKTRSCESWCQDNPDDDACCNADNKCVYDDVCYNPGDYYLYNYEDKDYCIAYCESGLWYDTDNKSEYCAGCIGTGYWNLSGEYESKKRYCCQDDVGEYKIFVGIGNESKDGACCDDENDCMDRAGSCRLEYPIEVSCDFDGIDNDCDGKTDCSDTDCTSKNVCSGYIPEICNNFEPDGTPKDDDGDFIANCKDSDCIGEVGCENCRKDGGPSVTEICYNDFDDDCDLKEDCKDPDCIWYSDCQICISENCTNKIDDDCDGFIDYADWDCVCPAGTTLCEDNTCSAYCEMPQGCIDQNDVCEEGEGCDCEDCINERGPCDKYMVCDPFFKTCGCPTGTHLCDDGYCRRICGECGDGEIDPGEECDNDKFKLPLETPIPVFNETSECMDVDEFTGEALDCDDSCFLDTSVCGGSTGGCGDGNIDVGETCDGVNYTGNCSNFGFELGVLSCLASGELGACHFDTSGCYNPVAACNNNGKCEVGIGEDCTCADCLGRQASCSHGAICDETARCACKDGTTLCADGSCRPFSECDPPAGCVIDNNKCDFGEGCDCGACDLQQGPCKTGSMCLNEECTSCSILNAYWTEECIGCKVADGVTMVVEGTQGCVNKTVTYNLFEDVTLGSDTPVSLTPDKATFKESKTELNWTPTAEGDYYFTASIIGEEFYSTNLEVKECIPACDKDCDRYCETALCQDPDYYPDYCKKDGDGHIIIDENSETAWCESVNEYGLGPGQATCAAYYDCTPGWWAKPGETEMPDQDKGESLSYISDVLEWGECEETQQGIVRKRQICNDLGPCCIDQASCYCKFPADPDCAGSEFKPATKKACLAKEKFPFFTNMNMLIVVLILIGFYIWKTRTKK